MNHFEADPFDQMRADLNVDSFETEFGITPTSTQEIRVQQFRLLGLGAKERAILSVIMFMAALVFGLAVLLGTGIIALR